MRLETIVNSSLAAWLVLAAGPGCADPLFTPGAAIKEALANNADLKAADRQVDASRARETQALALPNPNMSLQVDQVPFANLPGGNYMVGIGQPILPGGQRELRVEAARLDTRLAEFERDVLRQDLEAKVADAFVRWQFELEGQKLARGNADAAGAQLAAARARFKAGEVPQVDVLKAELEANRAGRDVEVASARSLEARSQLNVLLGRPALAETPAPAGLALGRQGPIAPLAGLLRAALASRVELRQADAAIEREAIQRQLARTSIWTGTEVNAATGLVAGQPAFSTSVTFPLPFYRQQGEIAEAEANRARAEARREALSQSISLEVHQAYNEAVSAAKQVAAFTQNYVPQAQRLLDNAQIRFKAGEGSAFEVMEARRAHRETRVELFRAVLEHEQALIRLERAVGRDAAAR